MDRILISIIVPAYNIAPYIGRCLESLMKQEYTNLEIIVVNDGSTDNTGEIIDRYTKLDYRIKSIHKENGGVTSARMTGIEKALGTYIGFVDGDDYVAPEMYRRLLENIIKYKADISHCGYKMIFPKRVEYFYDTGRIVKQDKVTGMVDLLSGTFIEPGLWNKLFHRNLFQKMLHEKVVPENIKINEDLLMNYWLFKEARCSIYEDFCPYHYILRKNSAATSSVNIHKLADPIKVSKIILNDLEDNEIKDVVIVRLVRQLINNSTMYLRSNKELIVPIRKNARIELKKYFSNIMHSKYCPLKLKVMVIWTMISPTSYMWVHLIYERITGLNKKYSFE